MHEEIHRIALLLITKWWLFIGSGYMTDLCKYKLLSPDASGTHKDLVDGKGLEDGLLRIQALLAEWLRMENVVVLTAAGCSVSAGGRLMGGSSDINLENLVLDALEECNLSDNAKAIIRWRRSNSEEGSFEEWLSYLFNANKLAISSKAPILSVSWKNGKTGFTLLPEEEEELQRHIERAIYCECALELDRGELTGKAGNSTSGHIPFLAKLMARDSNLGRTHLFTLNYDTLFEQALEELSIQYFDGFSGKASARFDPAIYGLDVYYPGDVAEGRVRRFDKFLQLYKLHGSLHWFIDDSGVYRAQHGDLSFAKEYRKNEPEEKASKLSSDELDKIRSFGILPTAQKFTQILDMPYAHLFQLFHARLNQPQTFLIVLGYGFGDDHVTRIIETALMNPSLVMLVVEPNPDGKVVKRLKRYQNLGQRVFVLTNRLNEKKSKNATFADFAQNVMPDVKWLEDFRRLRKFEEQIRGANSDTGEHAESGAKEPAGGG